MSLCQLLKLNDDDDDVSVGVCVDAIAENALDVLRSQRFLNFRGKRIRL